MAWLRPLPNRYGAAQPAIFPVLHRRPPNDKKPKTDKRLIFFQTPSLAPQPGNPALRQITQPSINPRRLNQDIEFELWFLDELCQITSAHKQGKGCERIARPIAKDSLQYERATLILRSPGDVISVNFPSSDKLQKLQKSKFILPDGDCIASRRSMMWCPVPVEAANLP